MSSYAALVASMQRDILELTKMVAAQHELTQHVERLAVDSNRALRGHNGSDGLLVQFRGLQVSVEDALGAIKEQQGNIASLQVSITELKKYNQENPSMVWIFKYRPKVALSVITGALVLLLLSGYLDPKVYEGLEKLIHALGG